jgi:hypothetical protein
MPGLPARTVADAILATAEVRGIVLKSIELQKVAYFAHVHHLKATGNPLIEGTFEAWDNGPVWDDLYKLYSKWTHRLYDTIRGPFHHPPEIPISMRRSIAIAIGLFSLVGSKEYLAQSHLAPFSQIYQEHRNLPLPDEVLMQAEFPILRIPMISTYQNLLAAQGVHIIDEEAVRVFLTNHPDIGTVLDEVLSESKQQLPPGTELHLSISDDPEFSDPHLRLAAVADQFSDAFYNAVAALARSQSLASRTNGRVRLVDDYAVTA